MSQAAATVSARRSLGKTSMQGGVRDDAFVVMNGSVKDSRSLVPKHKLAAIAMASEADSLPKARVREGTLGLTSFVFQQDALHGRRGRVSAVH